MQFITLFIQILARSIVFLLFLHVILSMFMPADKPIRIGISRIVEPILNPIRRFLSPLMALISARWWQSLWLTS